MNRRYQQSISVNPNELRHVQANRDADTDRITVEWDKAVPGYAASLALYGFMFGASLWFMIIWYNRYPVIESMFYALPMGFLSAGVFGAISLIIKDALYPYRRALVKPDTPPMDNGPVTSPDTGREVTVKTIRGNVVIVQPRAGAFVSWLKDTINPDNKVTFSKRQAAERRWEDWQYINLVAQLKNIGWLHEKRTINGAPDIDNQYINEIETWIKTPLL